MKKFLICAVAVLGVGLFAAPAAQAGGVSWGFSYNSGFNNFNRGGFNRGGCGINRGPVYRGNFNNFYRGYNQGFNRGGFHVNPYYGRGGANFYYFNRGW